MDGADVDAVVARLRAAGCVFAEDEARILADAAATSADLAAMVAERETGLPLEQVVGFAEFCGLRVGVVPGVFVPRHRTELLVAEAAAAARRGAVVVDLCCGSGAVGLAVATAIGGGVELHAADIDPVAVRCAEANLRGVGGRVWRGDLDAALPARLLGCVDVLVANVPYVPTSMVDLLPREARLHEPRRALDGGADGLDVVRRLAAAAPSWLASGGDVLVETSHAQAPLAADLVATAGLSPRVVLSADLEVAVIAGRRLPVRSRRAARRH